MEKTEVKPVEFNYRQNLMMKIYVRTNSDVETAKESGYTLRHVQNMLRKEHVINEIEKMKDDYRKVENFDSAFILTHLSDMLRADIADILDEDGNYKSIHGWPKIWRQMVNGMDVEELFDGGGKFKKSIGRVVKAKFIDRMKAIQLLGDHIDVKAWEKQQLHIHLHEQTIKRIQAGRERLVHGQTVTLLTD